jgi:hypothetical protein
MKTKIKSLLGAALALFVFTFTAKAAIQVYDLKADWSDTQNPNGPWSYRNFDGALLSNEPFPWAYDYYGLVAITRATEAVAVPGVLEPGDIYLRLEGLFGLTVRWTAPADGTINISGNSYLTAPYWTLKYNGNVLSAGFGGAPALQNIAVQAGNHVEIYLEAGVLEWNIWPDMSPIGLNFTVTLATDSIDPVSAIENLALTVFEMNLQNGIENSLDGKLDAALNALGDANVNNDGAACNSLTAFINAVEAQRGNKITTTQADQLIAATQSIKASLNCFN